MDGNRWVEALVCSRRRLHTAAGCGKRWRLSLGAVKMELLDQISEKDVQQANQDNVGRVGAPADTFTR